MRSEELQAKAKEWIDLLLYGDRGPGWEAALKTASVGLIAAVTEELDRAQDAVRFLLTIAARSDSLCASCEYDGMTDKPCEYDHRYDNYDDCDQCGGCICAECRDGDHWAWNGKEDADE